MITLELDNAFRELTTGLQLLPRDLARAQKRALRKTMMWLQRQGTAELARQTGIKQKDLKAYRRATIKVGDYEGVLWLGLNPMPLHLSGRVSWSPKSDGARVKGRTYAGAFYRAIYGSERKVWIRTKRNVAEGHVPYHDAARYRPLPTRQVSSGRFPVTLLGVPLEDAGPELSATLLRDAEERYRKLLAQEINYVMNHERKSR